jgi:hypothetical protein
LKNGTGNYGESKAVQVFLLRVSCISDMLDWPLRRHVFGSLLDFPAEHENGRCSYLIS